eukprot:2833183-Pyramimonas_sp.AAC.1
MGVPSETVGFFRALCANNTALVSFEGAAETVLPVERGVGQGDPASMTLFALALDPVLRWIRARRVDSVGFQLACVDDCCFGLCDILIDLMPTLLLLDLLSSAIGLSLNVGKCDVLICGTLNGDALAAHMTREGS